MESPLVVSMVVVGAACTVHGLHRVAVWMEDRGWIFYRTKRMPRGAGGMAAMEVAAMLEPEIKHVIEEIRSEKLISEQDEAGMLAGHRPAFTGPVTPAEDRDCATSDDET